MDTTQTGVDSGADEPIDAEIIAANAEPDEQETTPEYTGDRPETERERVLREIAERRHAEMVGEENSFTEQAGEQPGIEERFPAAEPALDMVTIKVDGEERQVPRDKVLEEGKRALQKESAADKRLKEATEMRQAAEARAAQVEQFARELQARHEQDQGKALSTQDAAALKEQARGFMDKLLSGDEDAAIESLTSMMGRNNATPDMNALIQQATQAAKQEVNHAEQVRQQREADKLHAAAKTNFSRDFKDIAGDPMLYRLADQETLKVLEDHPEWDAVQDIDNILKEAGKRVREWRGSTATTTKQELKRGLSKPISGTSGRMPGAPEAKPKTTAQIIADQRRARGLPVY